MQAVISVRNLSKTYASGFRALKDIDLEIRRGEIFALLGPNGAGKTTLISIICGIVNPGEGTISVDGRDIIADYRAARSLVGLVPQELTTDAFESVWNTVSFSRGLFGKPADPAHIEKVLKDLSLWDKKDNKVMTLSGGMKRRLLIAKALLMRKLGKKQLTLQLQNTLERVPPQLSAYNLELANHGSELIYTYDALGERTSIAALLKDLTEAGIRFKDLHTTQSSLEDIFVTLVRDRK